MLERRCLKCHGGKSVEAEFDLSDREKLVHGGMSGTTIIPGRASDSLLYKLITHARDPHMPKDARKLSNEEIHQIADWIDTGAAYDKPLGSQVADDQAWYLKHVPASAKDFWSFQPLHRLAPPRVKNESWVRTPIDSFVLARMEAVGLGPNQPVDKRHLVRRAYLDLIGLPPTPAEVDEFLNDPAPNAFGKLVDHLLVSPHYGERWARHWLDLARFAESHGFEHDSDRPSAYHYRDFVIQALNADLPYDTFVQWQLAGDEFQPDNYLALAATGFLAAGVYSTQITKNEVEKQRYDEMDDMVATVGNALLGLTVGCAHCHDHKYDPIPQGDYYRMLSTFTTTVRSEIDVALNQDEYLKAKADFDRAHAPHVAVLEKFESELLPARRLKLAKAWASNPGWDCEPSK